MSFAKKLKQLMAEKGISQVELSRLTGIGTSSISQYVSGKFEPYKKRKQQIALALDVDEDYFIDKFVVPNRLTVPIVAKLLNMSHRNVRQALIDQRVPWGLAVKRESRWCFCIYPSKFMECTGLKLNFGGDAEDEDAR